MKLLILSCSTGEGHNSAAHALMESAAERGIDCEIADPVAFGSERARKVVAVCYNGIIQHVPRLFGIVYKAGDLFDKTGITSPVYFANRLYARNLGDYLRKGAFDAVICTHLYGMEAMTALRREGLTIPTYSVLTDYTCIPFLAETVADSYFIPHEALCVELIEKGIPAERVFAPGIPVGRKFGRHTGQTAARNYLAIPQDRRVYLVMSGGMGSTGLLALCEALTDAESGDFGVYVLVGRSDELRERLEVRFKGEPSVHIVTFTEKVNLYMEAADVLLSKAGGLSSTEAAVLGVPLVHTMVIPGCEQKNAEFFSSRGMSVYANPAQTAINCAMRLIKHPEAANAMRIKQRQFIHPDAADRILEEVLHHG